MFNQLFCYGAEIQSQIEDISTLLPITLAKYLFAANCLRKVEFENVIRCFAD